jgi:hypothetical protein
MWLMFPGMLSSDRPEMLFVQQRHQSRQYAVCSGHLSRRFAALRWAHRTKIAIVYLNVACHFHWPR